jgi:hypothetical protein
MFNYFMCALIAAYVIAGFFFGGRFIMLPQKYRLLIPAPLVILTIIWAIVR